MPSCPQGMAKQLKAEMAQEPSAQRGAAPPRAPLGTPWDNLLWGKQELERGDESGSHVVCSLGSGAAYPHPGSLFPYPPATLLWP